MTRSLPTCSAFLLLVGTFAQAPANAQDSMAISFAGNSQELTSHATLRFTVIVRSELKLNLPNSLTKRSFKPSCETRESECQTLSWQTGATGKISQLTVAQP